MVQLPVMLPPLRVELLSSQGIFVRAEFYFRADGILFPCWRNFGRVRTEFLVCSRLATSLFYPHLFGLHFLLQEDGGRGGELARGLGGEVAARAAPGAAGGHLGVAAQVVGQA